MARPPRRAAGRRGPALKARRTQAGAKAPSAPRGVGWARAEAPAGPRIRAGAASPVTPRIPAEVRAAVRLRPSAMVSTERRLRQMPQPSRGARLAAAKRSAWELPRRREEKGHSSRLVLKRRPAGSNHTRSLRRGQKAQATGRGRRSRRIAQSLRGPIRERPRQHVGETGRGRQADLQKDKRRKALAADRPPES